MNAIHPGGPVGKASSIVLLMVLAQVATLAIAGSGSSREDPIVIGAGTTSSGIQDGETLWFAIDTPPDEGALVTLLAPSSGICVFAETTSFPAHAACTPGETVGRGNGERVFLSVRSRGATEFSMLVRTVPLSRLAIDALSVQGRPGASLVDRSRIVTVTLSNSGAVDGTTDGWLVATTHGTIYEERTIADIRGFVVSARGQASYSVDWDGADMIGNTTIISEIFPRLDQSRDFLYEEESTNLLIPGPFGVAAPSP